MGRLSRKLRNYGWYRHLTGRQEPEIYTLFFDGAHERIVSRFLADPDRDWSNVDLHFILASLAETGQDVSSLARRIAPPIAPGDFQAVVDAQLAAEMSDEQPGILSQPRFVHKSVYAAAIGLKAGKRHFIETGTFTGQSLYSISALFGHLSTVEASPDLYKAANALFEATNTKNITTRLGDTREFLKALPADYMNDAVIFLDAHFSSGVTSRLYGECPQIDELKIVIERAPGAIVVVDDMRTMTGKNGYPDLYQVLGALPNTMRAQFSFDQLILMGKDRAVVPGFP
ncbi:MAG: hypothetical protein K2W78_09110 [Xanthobacteraceae bacterium]|nr:hypothetical protein [Xanthobacteraceae bacterium]